MRLPRPPFRTAEEKLHFLSFLHAALLYSLPLDLLLAASAVRHEGKEFLDVALPAAAAVALLGLGRSTFLTLSLGLSERQRRYSSSGGMKIVAAVLVLLSAVEFLVRMKGASLPFIAVLLAIAGTSIARSYGKVAGALRDAASALRDPAVRAARVEDSLFGFSAVTMGAARLVSVFGAVSCAGGGGPAAAIPFLAASSALLAALAPTRSMFRHPCKRCRGGRLVLSDDSAYCPSCKRGRPPAAARPSRVKPARIGRSPIARSAAAAAGRPPRIVYSDRIHYR